MSFLDFMVQAEQHQNQNDAEFQTNGQRRVAFDTVGDWKVATIRRPPHGATCKCPLVFATGLWHPKLGGHWGTVQEYTTLEEASDGHQRWLLLLRSDYPLLPEHVKPVIVAVGVIRGDRPTHN
jgi:hypothetical protein